MHLPTINFYCKPNSRRTANMWCAQFTTPENIGNKKGECFHIRLMGG